MTYKYYTVDLQTSSQISELLRVDIRELLVASPKMSNTISNNS